MAKIAQQVQSGQMPNLGPKIGDSQATFNYMSLKDLIALAYKLKAFQVSGPDWMASERFDINAKLPEGSSKEDAPAMLQALLKDRFALVAHMDRQEHPVLALVVGKDGPKMKKATITPTAIDESTPLKPGEMVANGPDGPIRVARGSDGSSVINMGAKGTMTQRMDMTNKSLRIDSDGVTMGGFADQLTQVLQMGGHKQPAGGGPDGTAGLLPGKPGGVACRSDEHDEVTGNGHPRGREYGAGGRRRIERVPVCADAGAEAAVDQGEGGPVGGG